jgi:ribonuclease J
LSRGFVHEDESQEYLNEARQAVLNAVTELSPEARTDIEELKSVMRQTVKRFVKKSRERRPMILPVVLEF